VFNGHDSLLYGCYEKEKTELLGERLMNRAMITLLLYEIFGEMFGAMATGDRSARQVLVRISGWRARTALRGKRKRITTNGATDLSDYADCADFLRGEIAIGWAEKRND
jgi:hypothetical protein